MMPAVANDGQKENLSQISTTIPFALCVNIKTRNKWESLKQQNLKKRDTNLIHSTPFHYKRKADI